LKQRQTLTGSGFPKGRFFFPSGVFAETSIAQH